MLTQSQAGCEGTLDKREDTRAGCEGTLDKREDARGLPFRKAAGIREHYSACQGKYEWLRLRVGVISWTCCNQSGPVQGLGPGLGLEPGLGLGLGLGPGLGLGLEPGACWSGRDLSLGAVRNAHHSQSSDLSSGVLEKTGAGMKGTKG